MSNLNKGEVAITLAGTEHTMKPSLKAFSTLSAKFETYGELLNKIAAGNVVAMAVVIRAGLDLNDAQSKSIPERLFRSGIESLKEPLLDFVFRLFNDGKSPDDLANERSTTSDEEEAGGEADPFASV